MNTILKLINDLSEMNNDNEVKVLDITNDSDYEEFVETVNELKNDKIIDIMSSLFNLDTDDICNYILEIADKYHSESKKSDKDKNVEVEDKQNDKIERPSSKIDVNMGLQIHKLVQEYVDTMIKPYNPKSNGLSDSQINDAYAGLYEFACWIYNHK